MVFVLDANKKPLSPCHEAVARKLLKQGEYSCRKMINNILYKMLGSYATKNDKKNNY
jgi:hypothetical protein